MPSKSGPKDGTAQFHETCQLPGALRQISEIAKDATAIKDLYAKHSVRLRPQSGLAQLISAAHEIADDLGSGRGKSRWSAVLLVVQLLRLAKPEVVSILAESANSAEILGRLTQGSLDAFDKERSPAKDALWELEFCAWLRATGLEARLAKPDGSLAIKGRRVGIECKRLYSEAGVEKVLSKARKQIRESSDLGIIALDLEDLYPAVSPALVGVSQYITQMLRQRNAAFYAKHARHISKTIADPGTLFVVYSAGGIFRAMDAPVPLPYPDRCWEIRAGLALDPDAMPVLTETYERIMRKSPSDI
jgi:hypothetical protein